MTTNQTSIAHNAATQTIIARNAGALYGVIVGNPLMNSLVAQASVATSGVDALLNQVYMQSVGATSTATVAATLIQNLGITGALAIQQATDLAVATLNANSLSFRGAAVNDLLDLFVNLTNDANFGAAATAFNAKVANAEAYALVAANGTFSAFSVKTDDASGVTSDAAVQGAETINLTVANDTFTVADGNFIINGLGGNDTLTTGIGTNTVNTLAGDDTITTGAGNDTINAGDGHNTITAGTGTNIVTSGSGNDKITTGAGDDTITAGAGDNTITAGDGTNTVTTLGGSDTITTGAGNDIITAGAGNDIITAGAGNDIFNFAAGDSGLTAALFDTINDYSNSAVVGTTDKLVFTSAAGVVGATALGGNWTVSAGVATHGAGTVASFISAVQAAGTANETYAFVSGSDTYVYNTGANGTFSTTDDVLIKLVGFAGGSVVITDTTVANEIFIG
ncbi:MAG: calcium-binding protein [Methylobacter sp.]|uniref:Calcium-binding protein n=1 Tax=Candidatus Methylobacter titanis TaxID=3053457 RepID=A0AA43TL80_9GAMM|nr:calcium-binding protein [Candidatus Methylobacter titanis]